ncbi:zinc finger protein 277-like [Pelomyxa schiedti]|nr:zinc finger protein 277-like [Pelomyxa schiedti]
MKTKKHMRINPKLPLYDRFFISSYTPEQALRENEDSEEDPTGDTIDDWQEEPKASDTCCLCLFCDMTFDSSAFMLSHCSEQHLFNLTAIQSKWELTYYDTVMLVNFIRSSVKNNTCVQCYTIFASKTLLLDHMTHVKHFTPDSILRPWNSEKFLFPVLDPDPLLFCLDPNDSDAQEDTPTQITPTTGPNTSTTSTNPTAVKPSEPPHKP